MRSRRKAARMDRRELRKLDKELSQLGGFGEPRAPQPHKAKDFLGAAVTVAVIGVILLQVTTVLASRCGAKPGASAGPGSCSGVAAFAHHAHLAVTLAVAVCAAVAVIAFIWYMLWGYKANGQAGNQETPGP